MPVRSFVVATVIVSSLPRTRIGATSGAANARASRPALPPGRAAIREKAVGRTKRLACSSYPTACWTTTGVTEPAGTRASPITFSRVAMLPPDSVATIGAPTSWAAATERLRSPTATALPANTRIAAATVSRAITPRVPGRRATCRKATAGPARPARSSRRPIRVAIGAAARETTSPTARASTAGAASASGPVRLPVTNAPTISADAVRATASAVPSAQPGRRGGTRRRSAAIGSRPTRSATTQVVIATAAIESRSAATTGIRTSRATSPGSTSLRASQASPNATATPTGTPARATVSSSRSRYARAPVRRARAAGPPRPRVAAARRRSSGPSRARPGRGHRAAPSAAARWCGPGAAPA